MKLGKETGSLINHVMSSCNNLNIKIGDGATLLHWTDRTACSVVSIENKGKYQIVGVQEDKATRCDSNGMSDCQDYNYSPNTNGRITFFKVQENKIQKVNYNEETKRWKKEGGSVIFGTRNQYHDYSF